MSDLQKAALAVVHAWDTDGPVSTMEDLRAALAQPEQLVVGGDDLPTLTKWTPQRKPLTEVEIYKMFGWYAISFVRAVEKAHGIGGES